MVACMDSNGIEKAALIPTMVEPFLLTGRLKKISNDLLRSSLVYMNPLGRFEYDAFLLDKKGYFHILNEKYRIIQEPDNQTVAEAIEAYPDRFLGWIFVNPAAKDPMTEIEKYASKPGMIGVKAHPFWHRYPISMLDPVAGWCRDNGYPLLIHLGSMRGSGDYKRLPETYPGLKILYAHAGIPYYRKLWDYSKAKKDIYIDLSSPYLNRRLIKMAVDALGPDRCLYGTDGPYGEQARGEDYDYGHIKGMIEGLPLSDRELQKIFSENFESIKKV
jgi:predicted TIM-barrel fold metal-dependent hydrolase